MHEESCYWVPESVEKCYDTGPPHDPSIYILVPENALDEGGLSGDTLGLSSGSTLVVKEVPGYDKAGVTELPPAV